MAEFALLSGINYAGHISESNIPITKTKSNYNDQLILDDYKYSNYHTNIISKTNYFCIYKYKLSTISPPS